MSVNVVMPQMGESVAEGTLTRWIKQRGEAVDRDEPLFEISTDKVDAEIPSPAAGVLAEIRVQEGDTVPVDTVVAVIAAPGERVAEGDGTRPDAADAAPGPAPAAQTPPAAAEAPATGAPAAVSLEDERARLRRQKSSPLVRKIAREHSVELAEVPGTGVSGRVTKADILRFIDERQRFATAPAGAPTQVPAFVPGEAVEIVPMTVMRRKIAEHMVLSRRTSAHVHSVFEVDFTHVARLRAAKKADYERVDARLTFLSFIAAAVVEALRAMPVLNASLDGANIVYKKDVNLGIAVALDWGLIVPVIRRADEKNLLGLSRAIQDLAARARAKQLQTDEVQGGTFTITNPGTFGTLVGMPIINQPQVGILGVGTIEKRVAVIDDAIAIRQRAYLTLGFDHRLVDGSVADQFMQRVKRTIEAFDPARV